MKLKPGFVDVHLQNLEKIVLIIKGNFTLMNNILNAGRPPFLAGLTLEHVT
jgi:hypothetical protein